MHTTHGTLLIEGWDLKVHGSETATRLAWVLHIPVVVVVVVVVYFRSS